MATSERTVSKPPRSAVVTVSYGSGEALEAFLRTLREFHEPDLAVVVVDNKPDVENVEDISRKYDAIYVALPANPGYGAGMNAGVRALEEGVDAYFFCNPDVTFMDSAVTHLTRSLTEDPAAGSIGPRILNSDGSTYPSARNIPAISTGLGHTLFSKIWPQNPWTRRYVNAENYDLKRSAGSLSGAAVMVKREVFDLVGGWDEAYFMHFEDIDLGYRIGLAGFENIYDPGCSVHHSGAHSTQKHKAVVEQAMTESAIRFLKRRYAGFWNSPLRLGIVLGLRMRGTIKLAAIRRSETH